MKSSSLILSLAVLFSTGSFVRSLAVQKADAPDKCPPDNDIDPCYCIPDPYSTSVNCERVHDQEKLKGILNNIKGLNLSIAFWNSRLGDIPSDFFQGQITEDLRFQDCQIGSFGDRPFSGLENTLESISIYGSVNKRRKDLQTFPLGHLKKLKYLSFQANDIKKLGNEWFEGGPITVQQLSLEANDIEELGDKAFSSLVNLEQLWLGDNRFGAVSRSMLPKPAKKLHLLEISFNGIETLPADLFSDMPSLTTVNVAGNKLETLEEGVWSSIWSQLEEVYVDRNRIECNENLKWIYRSKLPQILDGKCAGYNKLRGKDLETLTLDDFE